MQFLERFLFARHQLSAVVCVCLTKEVLTTSTRVTALLTVGLGGSQTVPQVS